MALEQLGERSLVSAPRGLDQPGLVPWGFRFLHGRARTSHGPRAFAKTQTDPANPSPAPGLSPIMKVYAITIALGAVSMFAFGRVLALTQGCSGFCDPAVSTSFGAIAGLIAARMIRTA